MNTYYLKKFRKWAKEFVCIYCNKDNLNMYDVRAGVEFETKNLSLDKAKEVLAKQRRYYILKWCKDRKIKKLNKQLAKL